MNLNYIKGFIHSVFRYKIQIVVNNCAEFVKKFNLPPVKKYKSIEVLEQI